MTTPTPSALPGPVCPNWIWVPIRSLGPRHRERILVHLLALGAGDRHLRFGFSATDAQICKYVDVLDFEQDEVFGIFSRRLTLSAVAHLARAVPMSHKGQVSSEFGVSVLPVARRRGFGSRLFEHAILHARNRGVDHLRIHALGENPAMLRIADNAGAVVRERGAGHQALLELPPDKFSSHVDELLGREVAASGYHPKEGVRPLEKLMSARITEE